MGVTAPPVPETSGRRAGPRRPGWIATGIGLLCALLVAVGLYALTHAGPRAKAGPSPGRAAAPSPGPTASPSVPQIDTSVPPTIAPVVHLPPAWFGAGTTLFDDEFGGSSLDATKWTNCYPWGACTNKGNDELEWYTPANVTVGGGELDLIARHERVDTSVGRFDYSSGLIQTAGHFSFTYGYSEVRAWLPGGKGFWPSIFLLPTDGSWPPEIDTLESKGAVPNEAALTLHFGTDQQDATNFDGPDFTAGWHTFGVDWEPNRLTWYIDGVARKAVSTPGEIPSKPMYLVLSLAIDGRDRPDLLTNFSTPLRISYVRVWRH
jgi:beta-glucanase (GH16 family)